MRIWDGGDDRGSPVAVKANRYRAIAWPRLIYRCKHKQSVKVYPNINSGSLLVYQ